MRPRIEALEEKLGYQFQNGELLTRALTHRSWLSEHGSPAPEIKDNEQLEFLGDSILGFVVSESLVLRNPFLREGDLSQWKAHLVSASHLHQCALNLGFGAHLLLGKGEESNGGRERKTLLANAFEAVIAAVHLDGGIQAARAFIERHVLRASEHPDAMKQIGLFNSKTVLQEQAQALGMPAPQYQVIETSGPEHAKVFTVEVRMGDRLISRATGSSKKGASQHAAQLLIEQMEFVQNSTSDGRLGVASGSRECLSTRAAAPDKAPTSR
jgi:ribonuclease III